MRAYDIANALEAAGHKSVRFTVHEDCGHVCWERAYGGRDLYDWSCATRDRDAPASSMILVHAAQLIVGFFPDCAQSRRNKLINV